MKRAPANMNTKYQNQSDMKQLMEMNNLMQSLDKGRRKYETKLSFSSRHLLSKTLQEMRKSISSEGYLPNNFDKFVEYVASNKKSKVMLLSFDELKFLTKFLEMTIDQYNKAKFPWYKLFTRLFTWLANKQYKEMLVSFKI